MKLSLINQIGKYTDKKIDLLESIFNIKPNKNAIYLDIKSIITNKRQGTHKAKNRSEVKGSTKKIKKQKGTGSARAGSIKSPIFKGGGITFGPKPREYKFKINKKIKKIAKKSILSYKIQKKNIITIENFQFSSHKTKNYLSMLKNLSLLNKKTLLILGKYNKNISLSGRNIKNTKITTVNNINTHLIMNAEKIIINEDAVEKINKKLK